MSDGHSAQTVRRVVVHTLGDVEAFYADVIARLGRLGFDVAELPLGHVAYRCRSVDDYLEAFRERHADVISGQQDQGPFNQPLFISLGAGRMVKFHQRSLRDVAELEGQRFDGIHHA